MSYIISCCSTCDLSADHLAARDIRWLPFHFFMDEVEYADDLGKSMSYEEFYRKMSEGAITRTSQVSVGEYEKHFTALLQSGQDVLHLTLSSGLSGSFQSATMAAETVRKNFPDRKLLVIDSMAASSGYGLLMETVADKRDEGLSIDELAAWVEDNKFKVNHWFFSTDLTFYVRGGRVSKVAGWFGGLLDICPLLCMDKEGKLVPRFKIRTKKRVIAAIVDKMAVTADNSLSYDGKVFISQSACPEDAKAVAEQIDSRFTHMNGKVLINHIGTTIGSHSGPGTVALFFFGDDRRKDGYGN